METELKYKRIIISDKGLRLKGNLFIPNHAIGMIIFSYGSRNSQLSPRNDYVAEVLQKKWVGHLAN